MLPQVKGNVYVMGDNQEGQLGIKPNNGTMNQLLRYSCPAEVNIPSSAKPVHVSCGDYHTALITGKVSVLLGLVESLNTALTCRAKANHVISFFRVGIST